MSQAFPRILIFLLFITVSSTAQNSDCSSSCGNIRISFPFRLRSCGGSGNPSFQLDCWNNQTTLTVNSKTYLVREINYDAYSIRLVDPNINRANLSSCPLYSTYSDNDWSSSIYAFFYTSKSSVTFIHCLNPVNSVNTRFLEAPFCGNKSSISANSSGFHSYVIAKEWVWESELEPSCKIDRLVYVEADNLRMSNPSLRDVYDAMASGFEVSWYRLYCGGCDAINGSCNLEGSIITCRHYCSEDTPYEERSLKCKIEYWGFLAYGIYAGFAIAGISVLKFVVGFPLLIVLVVYKWRKMKKEDQPSVV